MPEPKSLTRKGKTLATLPAGDRRRLSDGRNAWRKMSPDQRRVFLEWMAAEDLEVASTPVDEQRRRT